MGRLRHHYKQCKRCGVEREQVGHITGTGLCVECALTLKNANAEQLRAHAGPYFDHWRRRVAASVGAALLDDL
jgi:hypothetical protein